jgi:predicted aconitase
MRLTPEEEALLKGERGEAARRAMQIVVTLGRIYDAECLLPVESAQVAGVSYRNLGDAGLEFLRDWAAQGARVTVPATLNPAGMDMRDWRRMGISPEFARLQEEVVRVYGDMGVSPTCTCTPYLVGNVPSYGAHIAWSESSAVCYANAVLGARTNREGGPGALAAAICGRTAAYGLHLDAGRVPTHRVRVRCAVRSPDDFGALGYWVGRWVGGGVPYIEGLDLPPVGTETPRAVAGPEADASDALKLMGAALASSGAVALYHVHGVTPEARMLTDLCPDGVPTMDVEDLAPARAALNSDVGEIDLVVVGCPHASLAEMRRIAGALRGRRLRAALWVTTSRPVRETAEREGLVAAAEEAGGLVLADGCVVIAPMAELPYHTVATNSAKMATYALGHAGLRARFGSLEQCLDAAATGRWPG